MAINQLDDAAREVVFVDAPRAALRDYAVLAGLIIVFIVALWVILGEIGDLQARLVGLTDTFIAMRQSCRGF